MQISVSIQFLLNWKIVCKTEIGWKSLIKLVYGLILCWSGASISVNSMKLLLIAFVLVSIVNQGLTSCCCGTRSQSRAFLHNNRWYQIVDCPLPWKEARRYCRLHMNINGNTVTGGELVTIENRVENEWLRFIINGHYGGIKYGIWMGLKRNSCQSNWYWTDGTSYNFFQQNWVSQQPNCQYPPTETCGHFIDNFRWSDAECGDRFKFICKRRRTAVATIPPVVAFTSGPAGPGFDLS